VPLLVIQYTLNIPSRIKAIAENSLLTLLIGVVFALTASYRLIYHPEELLINVETIDDPSPRLYRGISVQN
jgi:hypothetical protein